MSDDLQQQLFAALQAQDLAAVRDALDRGADVNGLDDDDNRPIEHACGAEILELLFERGADVRLLDRDTPLLEVVLRYAEDAERGVLMTHLVRLAVEGLARGVPVDLELDEGDGYRVLHLALRIGALDAAEQLLRAGARIDTTTDRGDAPLHIAVWERHVTLVTRLLELGATHAENSAGWTPLHLAVRQMDVPIAKALLAAGAVVDARDHAGRTPLYWLADPSNRSSGADHAMLDLLLAHGAKLHVRTSDDWTALHAAVLYRYPAAVQLFLDAGISPDVVTAKGQTPLALAIELDEGERDRAARDRAQYLNVALDVGENDRVAQRWAAISAEIVAVLRAHGATK
jgi:hypothetical protein